MASAETKESKLKPGRKEGEQDERAMLPVKSIRKLIQEIETRIQEDKSAADKKLTPREFSGLCNSAEKLGRLLMQRDRDRFAAKRAQEQRDKKSMF